MSCISSLLGYQKKNGADELDKAEKVHCWSEFEAVGLVELCNFSPGRVRYALKIEYSLGRLAIGRSRCAVWLLSKLDFLCQSFSGKYVDADDYL